MSTMAHSPTATDMSGESAVVQAWSQSSAVLARLLEKQLLILGGSKKLTRHTCVANRELIIPMINLVGFLDLHASYLKSCR